MTLTTGHRDLLAAFEPTAQDPFDLAKAGHLLRRTAFGGSLEERLDMVEMGVTKAVDRMFEEGPGEDMDGAFGDVLALSDIKLVRAYRFWRMLRGRRRLRERMSFFWHCHFATSNQKVKSPRMMARQMATFDRLGLGTFDELLLAVSRDPAMIRWLDNDSNIKGRPNENYARELFELFALGRGNYTEKDIKEAARAFTGWHLRGESFRFLSGANDNGDKEVFGKRGRFGGEDIVAMTVRREASARFIARKLLAFFVHPEPTEEEIAALAALYQQQQRHLGKTLNVLLRSRVFFSDRAYRSRIKSPVDLAVSLVRSLDAGAAPLPLANAAGRMGQVLLEPPTVEGWHGERAWISSATWLLRGNFAASLFGGECKLSPSVDELFKNHTMPRQRADLGLRLLLDDAVPDAARERILAFASGAAVKGAGGVAALLHAIQCLPEGQML